MKSKKILAIVLTICLSIMAILPIHASDTAAATASGGGCGYRSVLSTNVTHIVFSSYAECNGTPLPDPDYDNARFVDVWLYVSVNGNYETGRFRYPDEGSNDFVSKGSGGATVYSAEGMNSFMYYGGSVDTQIEWSNGVFIVY